MKDNSEAKLLFSPRQGGCGLLGGAPRGKLVSPKRLAAASRSKKKKKEKEDKHEKAKSVIRGTKYRTWSVSEIEGARRRGKEKRTGRRQYKSKNIANCFLKRCQEKRFPQIFSGPQMSRLLFQQSRASSHSLWNSVKGDPSASLQNRGGRDYGGEWSPPLRRLPCEENGAGVPLSDLPCYTKSEGEGCPVLGSPGPWINCLQAVSFTPF